MIRISAALRHRHGAEILTYDTRPFERALLRRHLDEALASLCDEGGYTIEDGRCSVVLRIEYVTTVAKEDASTGRRVSRDEGFAAERHDLAPLAWLGTATGRR